MHEPTSPDRPALFASVVFAPADAAPKLVMADWLDESGDPTDARLAAALRWMAALGKWPLVGRAPVNFGYSVGFKSGWLSGSPSSRAASAHYLPRPIAARLRPDDQLPMSVPGQPIRGGRQASWEHPVITHELEPVVVAFAIEYLSNALTPADVRRATRRRQVIVSV